MPKLTSIFIIAFLPRKYYLYTPERLNHTLNSKSISKSTHKWSILNRPKDGRFHPTVKRTHTHTLLTGNTHTHRPHNKSESERAQEISTYYNNENHMLPIAAAYTGSLPLIQVISSNTQYNTPSDVPPTRNFRLPYCILVQMHIPHNILTFM